MKCPRCGNDFAVVRCAACGNAWTDNSIDPTELLSLIEAAETRSRKRYADGIVGYEWKYTGELIYAVKSYLTGDPSALEQLAGGGE